MTQQINGGAPAEPVAYTVDGFCDAHHISRTHFYALERAGKAPVSMLIGRRRLITTEAAAAWRALMEAETAKAAA